MDGDLTQELATLDLIARVISEVCACNCDMRATSPTVFDAVSEPPMSVYDYLARIRRYTKFNFNCFLVAIWYLGELSSKSAMFAMTKHNVHRLLITAITVASKASDDTYHANTFMARCGGISSAELNALEAEMCLRLDWRLVASRQDLERLSAALLLEHDAGYWNTFLNVPYDELLGGASLDAVSKAKLFGNDEQHSNDACGRPKERNWPMPLILAWPACLRRMNQVLFDPLQPIASS
eukprot:6202818-Pleurochrysis_carterae.AAC.1